MCLLIIELELSIKVLLSIIVYLSPKLVLIKLSKSYFLLEAYKLNYKEEMLQLVSLLFIGNIDSPTNTDSLLCSIFLLKHMGLMII